MTPEQLDAATVEEAYRLCPGDKYMFANHHIEAVMKRAARLAREGWTHPETVDPDLLAAREWLKSAGNEVSYGAIDRGVYDTGPAIRAYLAGCTRGREGAKGLVAALEWLDKAGLDPICKDVICAALASAKRGG